MKTGEERLIQKEQRIIKDSRKQKRISTRKTRLVEKVTTTPGDERRRDKKYQKEHTKYVTGGDDSLGKIEIKKKKEKRVGEPKKREKKKDDEEGTESPRVEQNLTMWHPEGKEEMFAGEDFGSSLTHPFNTEEILKLVHLISNDEMRQCVVDGLTGHWDSGYEGPTDQFRDDSIALEPEIEQKILEEIAGEVAKGWTIGPFDRPPFPNRWCNRQALITRMFAIQKNKWDLSDLAVRLISHFSWPPGSSVNDCTQRSIPGVKYYTIQMFISKVARGGKGATVSRTDVMHAYRNIILKSRCWHQQVVKIFGLFYVQCCGAFGSVMAGDRWVTFVMGILEIVRKVLQLEGLDVFVDNFDNVVPGVNGEPNWARAHSEHDALMRLLRDRFHFPLHEEEQPSTEIEAHLGWKLCTMRQIVGVTDKRMKMMRELLLRWILIDQYRQKDLKSLIGVVAFVACVIPGMGAHLKFLRAEEHRQFSSGRGFRKASKSPRLLWIVKWLLNFMEVYGGETRLYDMDWSRGATVDISTDASVQSHKGLEGSAGCGAWCWQLNKAMSWKATSEVLEQAKRAKSLSVPYLELFCPVMMLESLGEQLAGQRVLITMDCEPAYMAARKRFSNNTELREIIQRMDRTAALIGYSVRFELVSRDQNRDADNLAKKPEQIAMFLQGMTKRLGRPFSQVTPVVPRPLIL
jgi:hypothetical protein